MGDVARRHTRGDGLWGLPRLTFTHWVLVAAAAWALVSAARAGTLTQSAGVFGLLDRFGFVPFAMFFVAPLAFATERQRSILLGTLVALGAYLGLTALFESVGLRALVFPGYISDPAVGIHFGRARGPFVEAVANGMGLFTCATAAAVGLSRWEGWRARYACWAVIALCAVGLLLTLTRSIWLSSVVAAALAFLAAPRLRGWLIPGALLGAIAVTGALAALPALNQRVDERSTEQSSVWVRKNTNRAAVDMIEARPVAGFGWQTFQTAERAVLPPGGDVPGDRRRAGRAQRVPLQRRRARHPGRGPVGLRARARDRRSAVRGARRRRSTPGASGSSPSPSSG